MGVREAVKQHDHVGSGLSLLLMSVQARLVVVALATLLLWFAVFWALR